MRALGIDASMIKTLLIVRGGKRRRRRGGGREMKHRIKYCYSHDDVTLDFKGGWSVESDW